MRGVHKYVCQYAWQLPLDLTLSIRQTLHDATIERPAVIEKEKDMSGKTIEELKIRSSSHTPSLHFFTPLLLFLPGDPFELC